MAIDDPKVENFHKVERDPITSIDQLQSPLTRSLYQWWAQYAPSIPLKSNFDITQHKTLPSNIYLIEVLGDGKFLYRLHGETVSHIVGRVTQNLTFSTTGDLLDDRIWATHLEDVVAQRTSFHCYGNMSIFDREYTNFESVDCPLLGKDGAISHIIGVLVEIKPVILSK